MANHLIQKGTTKPPSFRYLHVDVKLNAPLIISAPMRLIASAKLTCAVSTSGGLGFLGIGYDVTPLETMFEESKNILSSTTFANGYQWKEDDPLPIGAGFILWGISDDTFRDIVLPLLKKYKPLAVWLFAPRQTPQDGEALGGAIAQLQHWTSTLKHSLDQCEVWVQIGSVAEARAIRDAQLAVDVLVVQSSDAGGHGLARGAGLMTLLPEVAQEIDRQRADRVKAPRLVAAGGLATARQMLACSVLGAEGVVLGTKFLASAEANIHRDYQLEVVRASDGGQNTQRGKVYDTLRGTIGWPANYNGRGVLNQSWTDWESGRVSLEENLQLYKKAEEYAATSQDPNESTWGPKGRLTTYAGTGIGLVKSIQAAGDMVTELLREYQEL